MNWISVQEEVPSESGSYMVKAIVGSMTKKEIEYKKYFHKHYGEFRNGDWETVTHWRKHEQEE